MREKSERSLRTSELVRMRERIVRRCWTASKRKRQWMLDQTEGRRRALFVQKKHKLTNLTIIPCLFLVDRQDLIRVLLCCIDIHVSCMPYEILEQLVGVLLCDHHPCGLHDIAGILDELLAVRRKGVDVNGGIVSDVAQGLVDLCVGRHATLAEGLDDAIEADLAVYVGVLLGLVDGVDDGALCWVCGYVFWCGGERHDERGK